MNVELTKFAALPRWTRSQLQWRVHANAKVIWSKKTFFRGDVFLLEDRRQDVTSTEAFLEAIL